jgi:hypothetical protein
MKKRAFVRYSKKGMVVPGSLIITSGSYPQGSSTWKEVPADLCCDNPIELTYQVTSAALDDVAMEVFCNGVSLGVFLTNANSADDAELEGILNDSFGLIGTFNVVGTTVTLTMSATQKNELCASGKLSFTVFEENNP